MSVPGETTTDINRNDHLSDEATVDTNQSVERDVKSIRSILSRPNRQHRFPKKRVVLNLPTETYTQIKKALKRKASDDDVNENQFSEDSESFAPVKRRRRWSESPTTTIPDEFELCEKVINELFYKRHSEYAWPFYDPVDTKKVGLEDYLTVIEEPMDLNTVYQKLERRCYISAEEFANDVRLIFTNCYRFNPPDHEEVQLAKKLQAVFERRFAKFFPSYQRLERTSNDNANGFLQVEVKEVINETEPVEPFEVQTVDKENSLVDQETSIEVQTQVHEK